MCVRAVDTGTIFLDTAAPVKPATNSGSPSWARFLSTLEFASIVTAENRWLWSPRRLTERRSKRWRQHSQRKSVLSISSRTRRLVWSDCPLSVSTMLTDSKAVPKNIKLVGGNDALTVQWSDGHS